ncbi:MAG: hypothetical protein HYW95_02440 [Candidatus Wildermuthbacteria bacterium]|nr:hypothetical protein [Candidatus Wildermuthbacteria bacterium]
MNHERAPLLRGRAASPGVAVGPVAKLLPGATRADFPEGAVLVAPTTDPSMLLHMFKSVAIVTDIGGTTSHAAIVSRELGIPCVVATKSATSILDEGMVVEVDGTNGLVYLKE